MSKTSKLGCKFLITSLILLFIIIGAFTYGFHTIESWSKTRSVYFAITTVATIGYGDTKPNTFYGKLLSIGLIITSIFFIFILFRVSILIIVDSQINNLLETIRLKKENPDVDIMKKSGIKKISSKSIVTDENNGNDIQMTDMKDDDETEYLDIDSKMLSQKTENERHKRRMKLIRPIIYVVVYVLWLIMFMVYFIAEKKESRQFWCPNSNEWNTTGDCTDKNPAIKAVLEVFYFTIVTSGAIGYGDHYPITRYGKLFVTITCIIGVVSMAILAAELSNVIINCFGKCCGRASIKYHEQLLEGVITGVKSDDDVITKAQFLERMLVAHKIVPQSEFDQLNAKFDELDTNGNGVIDEGDFELMDKPGGNMNVYSAGVYDAKPKNVEPIVPQAKQKVLSDDDDNDIPVIKPSGMSDDDDTPKKSSNNNNNNKGDFWDDINNDNNKSDAFLPYEDPKKKKKNNDDDPFLPVNNKPKPRDSDGGIIPLHKVRPPKKNADQRKQMVQNSDNVIDMFASGRVSVVAPLDPVKTKSQDVKLTEFKDEPEYKVVTVVENVKIEDADGNIIKSESKTVKPKKKLRGFGVPDTSDNDDDSISDAYAKVDNIGSDDEAGQPDNIAVDWEQVNKAQEATKKFVNTPIHDDKDIPTITNDDDSNSSDNND